MSQLMIEDIARLVGVSHATASRVLNYHPSVRPAMRDCVWQMIKEYKYTLQVAARHLVNQRTHVIGVMFPRSAHYLLTNPIFASPCQGIGQLCVQQGHISVHSIGLCGIDEKMLFDMLLSRHFDSVVLISSDMNGRLPLFLKEVHIPYVRTSHDPHIDCLKYIDIDDAGGTYQAVTHLISPGHRRIV